MRINIYIKDNEVLEHIKSKDNMSAYVVKLVREDISNGGLNDNMKNYISNFIKNNFNNLSTTKETNISEFKDEIESIFDI